MYLIAKPALTQQLANYVLNIHFYMEDNVFNNAQLELIRAMEVKPIYVWNVQKIVLLAYHKIYVFHVNKISSIKLAYALSNVLMGSRMLSQTFANFQRAACQAVEIVSIIHANHV